MPFSMSVSDVELRGQNEKLITTLQECFSDMLKKQEEQADRLHKAVTALKPNMSATDKKTTFWNLYKTLADEHDKEIQQRYSTDLDTSLIFAGLFSAIDSAFIIQIQPQVQLNNPPVKILVASSLLYISLGSTLLAAVLAVLGKQWLMYYSAAGDRGTIEARGLERQRKFDGLRKWKFDTIMQMFPLLLQLGLLLFATALSVYLWTVHISLAIIVLSFTSFGFISYIFLLISAAVSPDSPFQTPLTRFVARLISAHIWKRWRVLFIRCTVRPRRIIHDLWSASSTYLHKSRNLLPYFSKHKSKSITILQEPVSLFTPKLPMPSPEVQAVLWVLETSADPHTVTAAAEMVVDLQWPSTLDLNPQMARLRDNILSCFDTFQDGPKFILKGIRNGMSLGAIHFGRAYCTLRCVHKSSDSRYHREPQFRWLGMLEPQLPPELANVVRILEGKPNLLFEFDSPLATKWALHVIPSLRYPGLESKLSHFNYFLTQFDHTIPTLTPSAFADYLFCVNTFLSTTSSRDMIWMDKSRFQRQLFEHLFKQLAFNLESRQISMDTAAKIIGTTGRVANKVEMYMWPDYLPYSHRQSVIYEFCSNLPQSDGWVDVVLKTGLLTGSYTGIGWPQPGDSGWVYKALENIPSQDQDRWDGQIETGVAGLFQALLYYDTPPKKQHTQLLLRALLISGDISRNAARVLLRENIRFWFADDEIQPILQKAFVWSSLARVVQELNDEFLLTQLIRLGHTLAGMPDWHGHIQAKLCSWITMFFRVWNWDLAGKFSSVLGDIWHPDTGEYEFIDDVERALGLTFVTLCKIWEDFDFTTVSSIYESIRWLRCTTSAIFYRVYRDKSHSHWITITSSSHFKTTFSMPLRNSLIQAASVARQEIMGQTNKGVLEDVVRILEDIASKIEMWDYWKNLRDQFDDEIKVLEISLQSGKPGLPMVA
ncbi:hypothetical protein C8R44DRAFT_992403 [Mycena epipterygia]|nr:hypothetical protein C8R44DRAFT_992403 [Mycena epipterygia]